MARWTIRRAAICATAVVSGALGDQVLVTGGFSNCESDKSIMVQKVDMSYDNDAKLVTFDVAGTSKTVQNVTATLVVKAYGIEVYANSFNPCEADTYVDELCPAPSGSFAARGSQAISPEYADSIPGIAFQIPDIAAQATLQLKALEDGRDVGCIKAEVTNGKTADIPAVSYIVAGIAGAAFVATGLSALGAALSGAGGAGGGGGVASPSFTEMVGVFQGFAMNGMMSVNHPPVYRSFAKNFGFSTGLFPWRDMQVSIDNFRAATGGNLTRDSVQFLDEATLVFPDGTTAAPNSSPVKRALLSFAELARRQIETEIDTAAPTDGQESAGIESSIETAVSGIEAYAEQLSVPDSNTFMTVLLVTATIIGSIIVIMLLVKVILEAWALYGNFPQSLSGFRKHYWGSIARTITSLILMLYGIWVLYCVYQFTCGDSWGAQILAGVTLALFTGILVFFSWKIWRVVHKLKAIEGDAGGLYDDKKTWMKYSLFYESYRRNYWWVFVPLIAYMFAKGTVLAAMDGHGMIQTIAMLTVEGLMLVLLLWSRPFERKSGNVINIAIQVVRFLSVVCVLFFVEEFHIAETTQTVTGVVLISIQSALTGILAILIAWNGINACCKMNPHRQRRKEMERLKREADTLTPLDARNSLLMMEHEKANGTTFSMANTAYYDTKQPSSRDSSPEPANPYSAMNNSSFSRPMAPYKDRDSLMSNAAPISQQPTLPYGGGYDNSYGGGGYNQNGYGSYRGL
ncbi:hypothetical protein DL767_008018 [Monosporascus sp. MG133]|nr:hypothetical protein DL767_008018 [Monosporascus sp. MG133]